MRRSDTWLDTLTITFEGRTVKLGVANKAEGFDISSEKTRIKPGGMAASESLGGSSSRNPATLSFPYTAAIHANAAWLERSSGGGSAVVASTPLDADKSPNGATRTFTGTVGDVKGVPEYDAESNDPALIEIEVDLDDDAT